MKKYMYAGIDVGGTKIAAALVTGSGKILCRAKLPSEDNASPSRIVHTISDLIEQTISAASANRKDLAGVGVGVPGLIDPATGKIIKTPNLKLSGINLQKLLQARLHIKVSVGNDANLGALGEQWTGAARGVKNVVAIFIGTGVGGGIIVNNSLIQGHNGAAGEIGHMQIQSGGPRCTCGNRGCLEAFAGRWAIERSIKKELAHGQNSVVTKLIEGKISTIKSKILRKSLRRKDPLVTGIMRDAAGHIGNACVTLRHIFDPDIFILGGGVIEACGDFMLPIIQRAVDKDVFFSSFEPCGVAAASLADDAVILGSVALVRGRA